MSPTTAGFAELKDFYVNVPLRGDRREALHFVDRLVHEGHSVPDIQLHDFPARLVADALDLAGYETRFLGADVPTGNLINVLEQESPDLLALSITMPFHATAWRRQVKNVRDRTGGRIPIAVGGLACGQLREVTAEIQPEILASSAHEMVDAANRLFGISA